MRRRSPVRPPRALLDVGAVVGASGDVGPARRNVGPPAPAAGPPRSGAVATAGERPWELVAKPLEK